MPSEKINEINVIAFVRPHPSLDLDDLDFLKFNCHITRCHLCTALVLKSPALP